LVWVDDPVSGKIWVVSKGRVVKIPELYVQMESEEPAATEQIVSAALTSRHLLGMSLAQ